MALVPQLEEPPFSVSTLFTSYMKHLYFERLGQILSPFLDSLVSLSSTVPSEDILLDFTSTIAVDLVTSEVGFSVSCSKSFLQAE